MRFSTRFLRWASMPTGRRVLFAITTAAAIALSCNPDLLPLLPMIDAVGLDVLVVLLGAHLASTVPWLRHHAADGMKVAAKCLKGAGWFLLGGYGREAVVNLTRFGFPPIRT